MKPLHLKLTIRAQKDDYLFYSYPQVHGPLFSRWLPDGERDAIHVNLGHPAWNVRFWFERCGFVDDSGFIRFDRQRREVSPAVMARQDILDAGLLHGLLIVENVSTSELSAVIDDKKNSEDYLAIGDKILKLLHPAVKRLLDILRVTFGQHWIRGWEDWDSRRERLGDYFRRLDAKWSLNGEEPWTNFRPTDVSPQGWAADDYDCEQYLSQNDWQSIVGLIQRKFNPSSAAILLAETHHWCDTGELKIAFVQGVLALEIAIEEFIAERVAKLPQEIASFFPNYSEMNNPTQLALAAALEPTLNHDDLEKTKKAIKTRNRIVHEGYEPQDSHVREMEALIRIVSKLLPGPGQRFPVLSNSNGLEAPLKPVS
jgi:hypothetical protein